MSELANKILKAIEVANCRSDEDVIEAIDSALGLDFDQLKTIFNAGVAAARRSCGCDAKEPSDKSSSGNN